MAEPLTWRNLVSPTGDPMQALALSNQMVNQGFNSLNNALTGYQKQQGDILAEDKSRNLQSAYETLRNQYKTPEALQAAIASGAVNQVIDPMGNRVDREKVINFADARVKDLRSNITEDQTFKALQAKKQAAPVLDAISAAASEGRYADVTKLRETNKDLLTGFENDVVNATQIGEKNVAALKNLRRVETEKDATFQNELKAKILNGSLSLQEAQDKEKMYNQNKEAERVTQRITDTFKQEEAAKLTKIKDLTKAFGLAINPKTGLPDYEKSDPEAVVAYSKELNKQQLDTNTASQYYNTARDALGKYHPDIQQKALSRLGTSLDPEPVLAPKDQAKMDNALANIVAKVDTAKKTNFLYQDPATATDELTALLSQAEKDMKKEDINTLGIRANLAELANKGMEIKIDGVTRVIPLTVKIIKQAYEAGKDPDTFWTPNQTESRIRQHLETVMSNPKNIKLFEEAENLRNEKYITDARAIKDSFYGLSGTVSSAAEASRAADYANVFTERLRNQNREVIKRRETETQDAINKRLRDELERNSKKLENKMGFRIRPGM